MGFSKSLTIVTFKKEIVLLGQLAILA